MDITEKREIGEIKQAYKDMGKSLRVDSLTSYVKLDHVNKIYPNGVQAVYDFSLDIAKNEFVVLVGPSGCGKSTTLRMIAGLEEITNGCLFIDKTLANASPSKDRDIAMVFQSYALYPHMNVYDNMAFALKIKKFLLPCYDRDGSVKVGIDQRRIAELERALPHLQNEEKGRAEAELAHLKKTLVPLKVYRHYTKKELDERVFQAAEVLNLGGYLDRKPKELSGGQMQRVALGRAIVRNPKLFLMDEPLSNLDAKLRVSMRSEIVKIHKKVGATTIYVTHDQTEAMTMADRIVVMNKGWIQQVDTPEEIYQNPANIFVATFIGSPSMNLLKATYEQGKIRFVNGSSFTLSPSVIQQHDAFIKKEEAHLSSLQQRSALAHSELWPRLESTIKGDNQAFQEGVALLANLALIPEKTERFQRLYALLLQEQRKHKPALFLRRTLKHILALLKEKDRILAGEIEKLKASASVIEGAEKSASGKSADAPKDENESAYLDRLLSLYRSAEKGPHEILLGIRPEFLHETPRTDDIFAIDSTVDFAEYLGSEILLHLRYDSQEILARVSGLTIPKIGSSIHLAFAEETLHLYDVSSGLLIK